VVPNPPPPAEPASFLPLTPVAFEILLALAGGERHGYAIMRSIEARTGGGMSLHAGTLYRAIGRLVDGTLLEELEERPGQEDDERRRYYRITALGRAVAAAESSRLESQVMAARVRKLAGSDAAGA
jgi:DNA-binding PadR family transcriptional regulator